MFDWAKLYKKYKVVEVKGSFVYEGNLVPDDLVAAIQRYSEVINAVQHKNINEDNAEHILVWQLNQIRGTLKLDPLPFVKK